MSQARNLSPILVPGHRSRASSTGDAGIDVTFEGASEEAHVQVSHGSFGSEQNFDLLMQLSQQPPSRMRLAGRRKFRFPRQLPFTPSSEAARPVGVGASVVINCRQLGMYKCFQC